MGDDLVNERMKLNGKDLNASKRKRVLYGLIAVMEKLRLSSLSLARSVGKLTMI
jgi:hypothetical protein